MKLTINNSYRFYSFVSINFLPPPPRLINSNNIFTSVDINALLVNKNLSISQKEFDDLLVIKSVSFELPFNDQTYPAYCSLVGKPGTRGRRAGVYIFTHILSDSKYVGSSNSLSRRLEQYFDPNPKFNQEYGLLLPLIKRA